MLTPRLAASLAVVVLTLACSKPTADDHLAKADALVAQSRLADAIIEYRVALQIDPNRGDIRLKLADAYMRTGELRNALTESVRAADLLPTNVAAQIRAGNLLLMSRSFEDAKARAETAVKLNPRNAEGLVLLGNALAGLKELDGALAEFQEAIARNPADELAYQSVGTIQRVLGQGPQAEAAFRKAIEVAPQSIPAHMGLANFLWAQGRSAEAEQVFKAALALDPTNLSTNRALVVFYMAANRASDVEPYVQTIANSLKTPAALFFLADYYASLKRYDDAGKILRELSARPEASAAAETRLAAIDAHNGQRAQGLARLRDVIQKHPTEISARLLNAHLLLADGKREDALAEATWIVSNEPTSSLADGAYLIIGSIYVDSDRPQDARKAFEEVLKRQSQSVEANVALSSLFLTAGSPDRAATYAQAALAARPGNALALSMMVRIYLVQGDTARARQTLGSLVKAFPKAPIVLNLVAAEHWAGRRIDAARAAYKATLAVAPNDIEATTGLVRIDLEANRPADALIRIDAGLKAGNPTAEFLVLAARTYGSNGQPERAEELLKRAIEVAPSRLTAYGLLGQLYAAQRRLEDASTQFQEIAKRNPKSVSAVTMLGILLEAQNRSSEAEKQYEAALAIDSRAPVASNNLAWLYVSAGRNLDQALQLAQTAQQQLPEEPHVNDTLGWICYQKGIMTSAVRHLESSVKNNPNSPAPHYHLGMAYLQSDEVDKAKKELARALAIGSNFEGADEARKALARAGG